MVFVDSAERPLLSLLGFTVQGAGYRAEGWVPPRGGGGGVWGGGCGGGGGVGGVGGLGGGGGRKRVLRSVSMFGRGGGRQGGMRTPVADFGLFVPGKA